MYKKQDFDFGSRGGFFAFSNDQFNEKKKEGVLYVNAGMGLILPKDKATEILKELSEHTKNEIKKSIEVDGLDEIIKYELSNYEVYYSGDLESIKFLVDDYGATWEQIKKIYQENINSQER